MITVLLTICLFLYRKNLEKTKACVWGITTRTIKPMKFYQEAKLKDGSATDEPLLFASQKSEETKDGIWGMTTRTMKSIKVCV